jgi:Ribonuclease P/MRP, subunit p29
MASAPGRSEVRSASLHCRALFYFGPFWWIYRWDLFVPLHRLWLGYMSELLALSPGPPPLRERADGDGEVAPKAATMPQAAGMHAKLVKADFHGSIMIGQFRVRVLFNGEVFVQSNLVWGNQVRRSRNAALVGVSGIVVQETENTFKVVTCNNKLKGDATFCLLHLPWACLFADSDPSSQSCQSKGLSSRLPSLCIAQNSPLLLMVAWGQTQDQTAVVAAAATCDTRIRCSMAHISSLSCTGTNSASARRIGWGESSSTRRPSSCEAISRGLIWSAGAGVGMYVCILDA